MTQHLSLCLTTSPTDMASDTFRLTHKRNCRMPTPVQFASPPVKATSQNGHP